MRNFLMILSLATGMLVGQASALPKVENMEVSHKPGGPVYITYDLDERAVVTLDISTNGVSIGAENFTNIKGDVNRLVDPGEDLQIKWDQRKSWPGLPVENVTFTVRAWSTNAPPDYLVYDFVNCRTNFYVSAAALPDGGLANDVYRTDRIVLRKIPAKNVEWMMGVSDMLTGAKENSPAHFVVLSEDFYMAIYETTQAQYRRLVKETELEKQTYTGEDADIHPADSIRYWTIRGSTAWPSQGRKTAGAALNTMRTRTGIDFDLPTEAQWEFACRAGVRTQVNSGVDISVEGNDTEVSAVAWTKYNTTTSQPVGMKPDNNWGLFDMHGNVGEWCCDYYMPLSAESAYDPVGSPNDTGVGRVLRGGGFGWSESFACTCGSRSYDNGKGGLKDRGFRLICPVTLKW